MFKLDKDILYVTLPEGKTQGLLMLQANHSIDNISGELQGLDLKINGRVTTGMALILGHKLAHICKSVSIFDPKEGKYFVAIKH